MDETSDEEEGTSETAARNSSGLSGRASSALFNPSGLVLDPATTDDARDMSVSTLHLYDLHLSQAGQNVSACCTNNCSERNRGESRWASGEETPLLHRP
ncbi:unnamed protein product [Parnassius apollo]|uniref:(apollo) hypothetical protein n=1 Tax=Parnassius apollo TaxID=110799 RepID=A0A8S3WIP9_PARAO|nr:unnamed protein product [Parnassius apollo]